MRQTQQKPQAIYASMDSLHYLQIDYIESQSLKPNHAYIQMTSLKLFQNTHTSKNKF